MAIEFEDMLLLKEINQQWPLAGRVLILGDCDFHFKSRDLSLALEKFSVSEALFKKQFQFSVVDTVDIAGNPTILHDLAQPFPSTIEKYDFIIDAGTIFHCFDVASALKNVNKILAKDGRIFHISALSGFYGRGYFNLHPKFFQDFYLLNGYHIENMWLRKRSFQRTILRRAKPKWCAFGKDKIYFDGHSFSEKFNGDVSKLPNNMLIALLAKKQHEEEIKFPSPINMQGA